jgi:hypothetical protein
MLSIPEELLLLRAAIMGTAAARPKRDLHALANEPLAAGRLIELVLAERVTVESRRHRLLWREDVVATQATPTGDALLDDVLERLAAADVHPCAYWIKHVAKGSEAAYWDRLVAKSLLRPDTLGSDARRHVANTDAVAAVTERITQSLFGLLNDAGKLSPAGLVRGYRAQQRDDRRARQALDEYERSARSAAGPGSAQPATAAAQSIARIAKAAEGFRGSGPG